MCNYCKTNENGEGLGWDIFNYEVGGANIFSLVLYADEGRGNLNIASDLLPDGEKNQKINYCPMCGRKL